MEKIGNRPATFFEFPAESCSIILASEIHQHTGSFKFRAARNLVSKTPNDLFIAASSGNFGQALAYACRLFGRKAIVVMPDTSAKVKIEAVRAYGGQVELVDVSKKSRARRVKELVLLHPEAYLASAYDDPLVIEGNATLGEEIANNAEHSFDVVVVPVGGGGLSAGIVQGIRRSKAGIRVIGAEPLLANDAARSLRAGRIVQNESEPLTLADGARTISLGQHNWAILKEGLSDILEVTEEEIIDALRKLYFLAGHRVEPTGALALAAVLSHPELFAGKKICCVVSGGNVDGDLFDSLLGKSLI